MGTCQGQILIKNAEMKMRRANKILPKSNFQHWVTEMLLKDMHRAQCPCFSVHSLSFYWVPNMWKKRLCISSNNLLSRSISSSQYHIGNTERQVNLPQSHTTTTWETTHCLVPQYSNISTSSWLATQTSTHDKHKRARISKISS